MTDHASDAALPTTMPEDCPILIMDLEEAYAAGIAANLRTVLTALSRHVDMSGLDGVTIAIDYDRALAGVDRGVPGMRPLRRSDTAEMQGVAMAPAVLRNGVVRTHLVFNAVNVIPLLDEACGEGGDEARAVCLAVVAHECAHVQVGAERYRAMRDAPFGSSIEDFERAVMFQFAEAAWDEYAVCRISAPFCPASAERFAETVVATLAVARAGAARAVASYRAHGDLIRLIGEAGPRLFQPMKAAAYFLGAMDAAGDGWESWREVRTSLETHGFVALVDALHAELARLWRIRTDWPPTRALAGLERVAWDVFASGGMYFSTMADGTCHIDVPIS